MGHAVTQTTDAALVEVLREKLAAATPGPWHPCRHLESIEADAACGCGYRGVIYGPEEEGFAVLQPGHEPPPVGEEGTEPPRYGRPMEIANMQLVVAAINALPGLLGTIEAQARRIEVLEGALTNVRYEAERKNGGLVHLKRAISVATRTALEPTP